MIILGGLALMKEALPVLIPAGMVVVGWFILKINKKRGNGSAISNRQ